MIRTRAFVAGAAALVLGAARAAAPAGDAKGEAKLSELLAGRTAGQPVGCLRLDELRSSQIVDGTAIVYEGKRNTLYVNRPNGASALRSQVVLVSRPHNAQLCKLDIVQLVDPGTRMPRGSVSLGSFVPYSKAPAQP
ncbi:hypothetical protein [Fulvimonas soli]|jgi:hypothetical protein|uniref:Uncharacterized protein n=1 Tax=Fulvimonas soli TaxID=155197 RepID=A0A316IZC8_9GAMM|nr:hypothetical protein [Fulvimonas soli]PWK92595.1 hypothetical protein C7456_102330 [Fulvimonas soli]TNY27800.1 hypothetical protein BV497_01935 [Fulvimonas soli]